MAEIFVSYTSSDSQWAQWIATDLRDLGHTPHVHEWEIAPGGNILAWMEQHHAAADHVLCVVSEAYLKAPYSTLERDAALWRAARERTDVVLFVVVRPCALPALIGHFRRCELFDLPEAAARQRFREFMTARSVPASVPFPGHATAESNITIRVPRHFMGREAAMAAIETTLDRDDKRAAITALHGMRGVGKTVLAVAYADHHRLAYRATWWVRAETAETMRTDLAELGIRMGWASADDPRDTALAKTQDALRRQGEGILLIFDNALDKDSIAPFLPTGGAAHVLITSNAHAWRDVAETVPIAVWPSATGAAYLLARTGRAAEQAAAEALSDTLGGLPLAHEMAAAYCEELSLSLATYAARFAAAPAVMLDDPDAAPAAYHDRLTVAKSFALAIEAAEKRHPAAEKLLVAAALLPPEPIPLFLLAEGREKLAEGLDTLLDGDGLQRAIAALRRFGLVDVDSVSDEREPGVTTEMLRVHRLIRLVAGGRRQAHAVQTVRSGLLAATVSVYPDGVFNNPAVWPRARRLDALALALADEPGTAPVDLARLQDQLALYRQGASGDVAGALPLLKRALASREHVLGSDHPVTLASVNNLAHCLQAMGDVAGAMPHFQRALRSYEGALGWDDPNTLISAGNLASCMRMLGDMAGALPLYQRAHDSHECMLGPDHPDVLTSVNNLAGCMRALGDAAGALPLYQRALSSRERVLGPDHPDRLTSVNNLAACMQALGDAAGALPLFQRAVASRERVIGPDHPDTLTSVNNLASCMRALGDAAGALPLFQRALATRERVLGRDHPATLTSVNNLAFCMQALGDAAGALPLYLRAAERMERLFGPDHPSSRILRANYEAAKRVTGRGQGST